MLKIIKSKLKDKYKKNSLNKEDVAIYYKDFVPAVRDWKNSIYVYNKNALSLIPVASRLVNSLIKGYFNSYNLDIESDLRKERLRHRLMKLSTNKIFVSDSEFKHTNEKVNITLYVYNRQKLNYLLKLKKRYLSLFKEEKFLKKLNLIRKVGLNILEKQKENIKTLTNVLPSYYSEVYSIQNFYYKNFIIKSLKGLKYYMVYKQLLYVNKTKFEYLYLQGLINLIRKIYKKNVEFNIINLKYFYFNSDTFTQPLVLKLRKERKLLRYLKFLVKKSKIKKIKLDTKSRYIFDLDGLFAVNDYIDNTHRMLNKFMRRNKTKYLKNVVLKNIKYKRVSGVRIEGAGRLTKRYTASRSQYKANYKGNLKNAYSSIKSYPSSILRGNFKPNLQQTKLNSKSRIGSFGVKGWVSGLH